VPAAGLVLWGKRGQAIVLGEVAALLDYQILACVDDDPATPSPFPTVPALTGVDGLDAFLANRRGEPAPAFAVAVGGPHGAVRLALHDLLIARGLRPATLVHPAAHVAGGARLGAGSQILVRAVVGPRSALGRQCIVNTAASVDHECVVGDGVHVGPGATVCGQVTIGDRTFVGAGAVVLPYLRIGADAVVGAGAVVIDDVGPGEVATGNPARPRPPRS
jgi:sugar O-acyltransferase (sialic acid O-acetyltransferase NeuD family)